MGDHMAWKNALKTKRLKPGKTKNPEKDPPRKKHLPLFLCTLTRLSAGLSSLGGYGRLALLQLEAVQGVVDAPGLEKIQANGNLGRGWGAARERAEHELGAALFKCPPVGASVRASVP